MLTGNKRNLKGRIAPSGAGRIGLKLRIVAHLRISLMKKVGAQIGWTDATLWDQLADGFRLVGDAPFSGVFKEDFKPVFSERGPPHGALTTPPLPESCRAASSARIASRALWSAVLLAESAAFVAYEASSVASALAPWSAVTLASRLASCAATKALAARPSRAFAILVANLQRRVQRWRQGGVQGCRGDCAQEGRRNPRAHL